MGFTRLFSANFYPEEKILSTYGFLRFEIIRGH